MYKIICLFSLFTLSNLANATPMILTADSLHCIDDQGKKKEITHDVYLDLNDDKCLVQPYTFLGFKMNDLEFKEDITLKINGHNISCYLKKGEEPRTRKKIKFTLSDNTKIQRAAALHGAYSKGNVTTLKEIRKTDIGELNVDRVQSLTYEFVNGVARPIKQTLNGEHGYYFDYYTQDYQKVYLFLSARHKQENIKNIKPIMPELNYVSNLTCGDHQVEQKNVSSTGIAKPAGRVIKSGAVRTTRQ